MTTRKTAKKAAKGRLAKATKSGDRRRELETLLAVTAEAIDNNQGHGLAALIREYRETSRELAGIIGEDTSNDPIAQWIAEGAARAANLDSPGLRAD